MSIILLDKKDALEFMEDTLNDAKIGTCSVNDAKYHHNTNYSDAESICRQGILTIMDLNRLKIRNDDDESLKTLADMSSHVNGIGSVSLSVVGLQDLYYNSDIYDPYYPSYVDFLVSNDINTRRSIIHYDNEFLVDGSISTDKLRSLDIRLLKLIKLLKEKEFCDQSINCITNNYNCLKDIALTMKELKMDMPLREMSFQDNSLMDIDKVADIPKLILKL